MKIKTISFLAIATILLITACNHVYKASDKNTFANYMWKQGDQVVFKPKIEDISKSYSVTFSLRHHYGVQFESIAIAITTTSPSGKRSTDYHVVPIRKNDGKYVAKCAGDLCDLETVILKNLKFEEAGIYTVTIDQNEGHIPGIMEVGLIIDEQ